MTLAEDTGDSKPAERPERITVAGPVNEVLPMSWTGRLPGSVKYPVSAWMTAASAMPMTTATIAITCGLRVSVASGECASLAKLFGRVVKAAIPTRTAEIAAEM